MNQKWKQMSEYELLEVDVNATLEEIEHAWDLHRRAWRPDRFPKEFAAEVTERFQAIKNAYETLSDPERRRRLDLKLGITHSENQNHEPMLESQFDLPEQRVSKNWKHLARWAKDKDKLKPSSRAFAYKVADQYLEKGRKLSDKQLKWAKEIWENAIKEGFDPGEEELIMSLTYGRKNQ